MVVYVYYLYVFEELGVPGGSACSIYMYDLFIFTLVGKYANMAEMLCHAPSF